MTLTSEQLPDVGNLHHFCHRFLLSVHRLHPGKHVLDESQQLDFIREVTDALREEPNEIVEEIFADYEEDDKSPYPDILSAVLISHQWRLGIPACYLRQVPPQMHELVECGVISRLERAYTGLKRKFQSVDFDDLVNETFLYLTKNPLDDDRRFDWIQIDEVQDLNPLQWRIVKELTSIRAVSVYFGDVEQSIFSFLGASASTFASAVADCERLVRGLGYRTVKVSGCDLFAYPLMRDFLAFVSLFARGTVRASGRGEIAVRFPRCGSDSSPHTTRLCRGSDAGLTFVWSWRCFRKWRLGIPCAIRSGNLSPRRR